MFVKFSVLNILLSQDIQIFRTVHIFFDEFSSVEVYASQKVWAEA